MCTQTECIERLTKAAPYIKNEYGVESMCLFGSMARGDNRPGSDVDILVDMPPKIFVMCALKDYLESLLKAPVDLVRNHSNLSQKFLIQVKHDAITIL